MAFALTELQSVSKYGNNTDLPSFTSASGELLLLSIVRRRNDLPNSIGTNHGTFTLVDSDSGNNRLVACYACISIGATGGLTVGYPSSNTGAASVIQVTGSDGTIPQSSTLDQYNGGGGNHTNTVTLSPFASATNATFLIGQQSGTTTGEVGYTQESSIGDLYAWYKLSEDTTPSFNTTGNFTRVKAVAFEIQETSDGNTVDVNDTSQSQTIEQVTLSENSSISLQGITQSQTLSEIALQQSGALSLNNLDNFQSISEVSLSQGFIITIDNVGQPQFLEELTLSVSGTVNIDPVMQPQTIEEMMLIVAGSLSLDNLTQGQSLEQITLDQLTSLAINPITNPQTLGEIILTEVGNAISINNTLQSQSIDEVLLSQLNIVSIDNLSQQQILQTITFGGVVVGYLQGALTIISAYNGQIKLTNPLTGEIRIL